MSRKSILTALVVCAFVLTAVVAQAGLIQNGGFESPVVLPWTGWKTPADWGPSVVVSGVVGNGVIGGVSAHAGSQLVFLPAGSADARVYQELTTDGTTLFKFASAGDTLTMNFWVAKRPEESGYDTALFSATLWAQTAVPDNGTGYIYQSTALGPTSSTWTAKTFTYTATAADVNKPLWFQLSNYSGGDGNHATVLLDDVSGSFTSVPIPEPSTLVLLAAGLAGLLCYAWRKRR